ncbi:hypothetical protein LNAOJCKE_4941 [Methylorubrum aminovorans]|uniref:Uncharacterized protein n=1 Tax=Methylorubrum aminovorans TaxID=269069 RepID=A0ABQ4UK57_9HYPH|nr:hypothetical protein [Methylorubrum aminovorans]GJE67709.1 hypothetical protein LNAOJCKE_4941 [Methylorubrum aminovorans]GMA79863.1 hypothetical protein GCM10025880_62800 [Methylorubrum aminovorans]GMA80024.1 hypothetical protein GCM10025880_64410 [Methylorubrum aminovorans]
MTQASHFTMTLDLAVQDPSAVLEAAATHLTRTGTLASVEAARAHLAGDVPKALAALIGLRNLAWAGGTATKIDCTPSEAEGSAQGGL